MRKTCLLLASLLVLLTGCYKEDVQRLLDDMDTIEGTKIPSMNQQIDDMKESVKEMQATNVKIQEAVVKLQTEYVPKIEAAIGQFAGITADIKKIKENELALAKSVAELDEFLSNEAATKEWAEGTFMTLEKQSEIQENLSGVNSSIKSFENKLDDIEKNYKVADKELLETLRQDVKALDKTILDEIAANEEKVKGWVNKELSGYYTAAKTQETIDELSSELSSKIAVLKAANEKDAEDILKNAAEIEELADSLDRMKQEVIKGYKAEIQKAVSGAGGQITEAFNNAIRSFNESMASLTGKVEERISSLIQRIEALEAYVLAANNKINTIDAQIVAIDSTILELKKVDQAIKQTITDEKNLSASQIDSLKNADLAILNSIEGLQTYINDTLKGTQDWLKATFATIDALAVLEENISQIKKSVVRIENNLTYKLNALNQAITDLESSFKVWVNEELQEDYDDLLEKINTLRTDAIDADSKLKDELLGEVQKASSTLTEALKEAVKEALAGQDGYLTKTIKDKFSEVSGVVSDNYTELKGLLDNISGKIDENIDKIKTISGQIIEINKTLEELNKLEAKLTDAYQKADDELKTSILVEINKIKTAKDNLTSYIGTLPQGADNVVDWTKATFLTLEKQKETSKTLSALKTSLDSLTKAFKAEQTSVAKSLEQLQKNIDTCSVNLRKWVSDKLTGYVTLGKYEADLQTFKTSVQQSITTRFATELETMKTEYKEYVKKAIEKNNTDYVDDQLSKKIAEVNKSLEELSASINTLTKDIRSLQENIALIKTAINSRYTKTEVTGFLSALDSKITTAIENAVSGIKGGTLDEGYKSMYQIQETVKGLNTLFTGDLSGLENQLTEMKNKDKQGTLANLIDALDARLKALIGGSLETDYNSVLKIQNKVKTLEGLFDTVSDLQNQIDAINNPQLAGTLANQINTIKTNLNNLIGGTLDDDFDTIVEIQDQIKAIAALSTDIQGLQSQIDDMKNKDKEGSLAALISALDNQITQLIGGTLGGDYDSVVKLQDKVKALEELALTVAGLQTQINEIKDPSVAGSLANQLNAFSESLSGLVGGELETGYKTIVEMQNKIKAYSGVASDIQTIQGLIDDMKNKDKDGSLANLIAALDKKIKDLVGGTLEGNYDTVYKLQEKVKDLEDLIETVDGLQTQINNMKDAELDNSLANQIKDLQTELTNLIGGTLEDGTTLVSIQDTLKELKGKLDAAVSKVLKLRFIPDYLTGDAKVKFSYRPEDNAKILSEDKIHLVYETNIDLSSSNKVVAYMVSTHTRSDSEVEYSEPVSFTCSNKTLDVSVTPVTSVFSNDFLNEKIGVSISLNVYSSDDKLLYKTDYVSFVPSATNTPSTFYINPTKLTFPSEANSQVISITSSSNWQYQSSGSVSWASVSPRSGNAGTTIVTISASKNDSGNTRSGNILFKSNDNVTRTLTVEQNSYPYSLSVNEINNEGSFTLSSSTCTFVIQFNETYLEVTESRLGAVSSGTTLNPGTYTFSVTNNDYHYLYGDSHSVSLICVSPYYYEEVQVNWYH